MAGIVEKSHRSECSPVTAVDTKRQLSNQNSFAVERTDHGAVLTV
jgi:hypothetical protein